VNLPDPIASNNKTIKPGKVGEKMSDPHACLDVLTITIPTYNRPHHLNRLLAYYQRTKLQPRFLVLDSSEAVTAAANAELVSSCGERFRHVVFPTSLPMAAKLSHGLALVETPFCAFCADDDLVFPEALPHALDFLQNHTDYVCTDGIYLNFFPTNGEISFQIEYGSRGIEADHPGARVFRLFQWYESIFYAVFRTTDIRNVFSFVKDIPSLHYQELFQAVAALLKGKTHRLPEFYAARQHCDPAEPTRDKWQTFYWFADNNVEFLSHYMDYRDDLWRFYESFGAEPRLDRQAFFSAMDMAHAMFFSEGCPPEYFYSRLQKYWPADPFKAKLDLIGVCHDLKSTRRLTWEKAICGFIKKLDRKIANYASPVALISLNKEAELLVKNGPGWKCRLPSGFQWMASVPKFRSTFLEVCEYLGDPGQ
jgi:glycosyltransferase domain-containing protein